MLWRVKNALFLAGEEERSSTLASAAKQDAIKKHKGSTASYYGGLSYYFVYSANGGNVHLMICGIQEQSSVVELAAYNLALSGDRQALLLAVVNLLRLAVTWAPRIPRAVVTDTRRLWPYAHLEGYQGLDHVVVVQMYAAMVVKRIPCPREMLEPLFKTYQMLNLVSNLNVSKCQRFMIGTRTCLDFSRPFPDGIQYDRDGTIQVTLQLVPVGQAMNDGAPAVEHWADVLLSLLQALCCVHDKGWVHRDIRWSNIVRVERDEEDAAASRWVLIDWELAGAWQVRPWFDGPWVPLEATSEQGYLFRHDLMQLRSLFDLPAPGLRPALASFICALPDYGTADMALTALRLILSAVSQ